MHAVIAKLEERLGKKAVVEYQDAHAADLRESRADITKAKALLDWTPRVSLDEGLDRAVHWYRQNRELACSLEL